MSHQLSGKHLKTFWKLVAKSNTFMKAILLALEKIKQFSNRLQMNAQPLDYSICNIKPIWNEPCIVLCGTVLLMNSNQKIDHVVTKFLLLTFVRH